MDKYEILGEECTICLDDLNEKKVRHVICYNKYVHEKCLVSWLKRDKEKRCPCCNQQVKIDFTYCQKLLCFNTKKYVKYKSVFYTNKNL